MEVQSKQRNCILEFTQHALERAMQVGIKKEQLLEIFEHSIRLSGEKRTFYERFAGGKNNYRYYRNGANVFVAIRFKGKLRIITVYDDVTQRNKGIVANIDIV